MKTPSSADYVIVTGKQLAELAIQRLEDGSDYFLCCAVDNALLEILNVQKGYALGDKLSQVIQAYGNKATKNFRALFDELYISTKGEQRNYVIWRNDTTEEPFDTHTARIIAATILSDIWGREQFKFYIPKAALTKVSTNS